MTDILKGVGPEKRKSISGALQGESDFSVVWRPIPRQQEECSSGGLTMKRKQGSTLGKYIFGNSPPSKITSQKTNWGVGFCR